MMPFSLSQRIAVRWKSGVRQLTTAAASARGKNYDFIIVGSGGGSIVARRLAEHGQRVLLLEAGPPNNNPLLHVPLLSLVSMVNFSRKYNWQFKSLPEPNMCGRQVYQPRGRVLGGSSSINGMIWVRGHPHDYDLWAEICQDDTLRYQALLPYFRRTESFQDDAFLTDHQHPRSDRVVQNNDVSANCFHGFKGPLKISTPRFRHPISEALIRAACTVTGLQHNADFCGQEIEGFGFYHMNQWQGCRWSAADGYLSPDENGRSHSGTKDAAAWVSFIDVACNSTVKRVVFEEGSSPPKAVGVQLADKDGTILRAAKEVILSAGVFQSPQILNLSGIGHKLDLVDIGIEPKVHLPGVGRNLRDHLDVFVQCANPTSESFGVSLRGLALQVQHGLRYLAARLHQAVPLRGMPHGTAASPMALANADPFNNNMLMSNGVDSGGFMQVSPRSLWTDVQFHFFPGSFRDYSIQGFLNHMFATHVYLSRPHSTGHVKCVSKDIHDKPKLLFNFLADPRDVDTLLHALKMARRIMQHAEVERYRGQELMPGDHLSSDADLTEYIRRSAKSAHHPVGTCRMGSEAHAFSEVSNNDDGNSEAWPTTPAVVSPSFQVFGCKRLRVVDGSVFPTHITGNPWGTIAALAEKAADDIAFDWKM